MNFCIPALKKWGYTGFHRIPSAVLFIHLSFCVSVLFCSLQKTIYYKRYSGGKVRFSDSSSFFFLKMDCCLLEQDLSFSIIQVP